MANDDTATLRSRVLDRVVDEVLERIHEVRWDRPIQNDGPFGDEVRNELHQAICGVGVLGVEDVGENLRQADIACPRRPAAALAHFGELEQVIDDLDQTVHPFGGTGQQAPPLFGTRIHEPVEHHLQAGLDGAEGRPELVGRDPHVVRLLALELVTRLERPLQLLGARDQLLRGFV